MTGFTEAVNSRGRKQRIPADWLEDDSPFASQFRQTPTAKQREERSTDPDDTWTVPQLREYVDTAGIEVPASAKKADYLTALSSTNIERASADPEEG